MDLFEEKPSEDCKSEIKEEDSSININKDEDNEEEYMLEENGVSEFPTTETNNECEFIEILEEPPPAEPQAPTLALLPPDHPLLQKFQQSLKQYLLRTKAQLMTEIDEIKYNMKQKEHQREEQGATLYDMQQEIQRQNDQLDEFATQIEDNVGKRQKEEEEVSRLKAEYDEKEQLTKNQKSIYNKRMVELEHLQELELNIRKWVDDVEDELKNSKRIVSRDAQLQKRLSEEKRKSDLLSYHLDIEVKKAEKEMEIIQEEAKDMRQIVNILKMNVCDANADLEDLESEHKRLTQAWSEVIVAISHRDRILYQVKEDIAKEKEAYKLCISSIQSTKKQIKREMQLTEKLLAFKKQLTDGLIVLRKECKHQSEILSNLEYKLNDIPDLLNTTEDDLKTAKREGIQLQSEIRKLHVVLDKWSTKKYELEENMLKLAQDQLINDKASSYHLKLFRECQDQRRALELSLSQSQHQLALILLEIEQGKGELFKINEINDGHKKKLQECENYSNKISNEIKQVESQTAMKMKRMQKLMLQIEELVRSAEGGASSPTELKIKQMEVAIQRIDQQVRESQQFWIILQNHFVNLSEKRSIQLNQVQITRKQLSIIKQKSLKVDQDLEKAENLTRTIERDIQLHQTKLEILNSKMFKRRKQHENEEAECLQEHAELLSTLRENEMNVLRLEQAIDEIQEDIDYHKDVVLDKHRESLSWETKYKLIEETLRWRKDENASKSELNTMRNEIHRMQIRHQQLKRAQEKLIQDLEHCVMHREQIFMVATTKQNIESQPHRNKQSNKSTQHRITDFRGKLKHIQTEIQLLNEQKLIAAQRESADIQEEINKLKAEIEEIIGEDKKITSEIEEGILLKHQNLENLIRKQSRAKCYRRLSTSAQCQKLVPNESALLAQMDRQNEINDTLTTVIEKLIAEFPQKKSFFAKLMQMLQD